MFLPLSHSRSSVFTLRLPLRWIPLAVLSVALIVNFTQSPVLRAQETSAPAAKQAPAADPFHGRVQQPVRTFHLHNTVQQNDANEMLVALRNILDPSVKIYLDVSANTIVMAAPNEQLELASRLITELDVPRKAYRLTYTLTTIDNAQRSGTAHFSFMIVSSQRTVLKQGSRIPVVTGSFKPDSASTETQNTYVDVGMSFDATLDEFSSGIRLRSKVEQSSLAPEQSSVGASDPVIRQTLLEGTSYLMLGKPVILGAIDVPGTTRHIDIDVVAELVP